MNEEQGRKFESMDSTFTPIGRAYFKKSKIEEIKVFKKSKFEEVKDSRSKD
jgi:hypothetical protein